LQAVVDGASDHKPIDTAATVITLICIARVWYGRGQHKFFLPSVAVL